MFADVMIQLSDGPDESRGRLELRVDGVWGSVCGAMFSDAAAVVFCRQIGYRYIHVHVTHIHVHDHVHTCP